MKLNGNRPVWGWQSVRLVLNFLTDLLFPVSCARCSVEGWWLCPACQNLLPQRLKFFCPRCQQLQKIDHRCSGVQAVPLDGLWFFGNYSQKFWQSIIASFKYQFVPEVGAVVGQALTAAVLDNEFSFTNFIVIPIPLHPKRLLWRTFNQASILAQNLGLKNIGYNILFRQRFTRAQAKLSNAQRLKNILGALVVKNPAAVLNQDILLVDDVYTTGATMQESAKVLKQAGARMVYGLVLTKGA